ncbi:MULTISPECIES: hypothetical protein [Nostoc]|uniref:Uncharacterized protein n=1 Tax=Nostoc punctiforme FACHB-252 TaxID=1357509 RepID=A0ABR8HIF3_NOSPU|nr:MULTISPECIES: hypothetical protein [Nostoc]MBC1238639.1 hypothetical protein [Nostoc sp. 2RC]MBD2615633.1 hypothetical protein [Nostoc punctiforme FACHB-252]
MKLNPVFEPNTLNTSKVYMIEGTQYRYVQAHSSGKNIKYVFSPLPNQRKTSEISLNSTKLTIKCQEVKGMTYQPTKEQNVVQMGLL